MRYLVWLIALFVGVAGVTGLLVPDRVMSLRLIAATQSGLLAIAVLRSAIGIVLIMVAPRSRAPKTLQVIGALLLLAGMVTPLFGVARSKAVLDWEAAQGPMLVRGWAIVAVALSGALAFVMKPVRH
ncbi:MAG TPA: hypothetical protein VKB36_24140 [Vicinamibacterales bacterium]|nr:hypothetical protein [Vicinamibacterales bacterium]